MMLVIVLGHPKPKSQNPKPKTLNPQDKNECFRKQTCKSVCSNFHMNHLALFPNPCSGQKQTLNIQRALPTFGQSKTETEVKTFEGPNPIQCPQNQPRNGLGRDPEAENWSSGRRPKTAQKNSPRNGLRTSKQTPKNRSKNGPGGTKRVLDKLKPETVAQNFRSKLSLKTQGPKPYTISMNPKP